MSMKKMKAFLVYRCHQVRNALTLDSSLPLKDDASWAMGYQTSYCMNKEVIGLETHLGYYTQLPLFNANTVENKIIFGVNFEMWY